MARIRGTNRRVGNGTYPGYQPPRRRLYVHLPRRMLIDFKATVARIIDVLDDFKKAEDSISEQAKQDVREIVQDMGPAGAAIRNILDRMDVSISVERKEMVDSITSSLGDIEFSLF